MKRVLMEEWSEMQGLEQETFNVILSLSIAVHQTLLLYANKYIVQTLPRRIATDTWGTYY